MEEYAEPFLAFIDREASELTADEYVSLEYYYASVNIAEGLPADTTPRRWCLMAQNVGRIAHMLGRRPQAGDPGATRDVLAWIEEQQGASLNLYQRARLRSTPLL